MGSTAEILQSADFCFPNPPASTELASHRSLGSEPFATPSKQVYSKRKQLEPLLPPNVSQRPDSCASAGDAATDMDATAGEGSTTGETQPELLSPLSDSELAFAPVPEKLRQHKRSFTWHAAIRDSLKLTEGRGVRRTASSCVADEAEETLRKEVDGASRPEEESGVADMDEDRQVKMSFRPHEWRKFLGENKGQGEKGGQRSEDAAEVAPGVVTGGPCRATSI
eukprot:TRINITY_DN29682_c0_g1_i1.p1 TRINITY_DN29682_c0_g1~~TRINITY_DN29682_c0_g1_i1.p1  ORF type:complete len:224 (+),score=37.58 TRINITY_DN29682_c0_g1_i1:638-1309(+)